MAGPLSDYQGMQDLCHSPGNQPPRAAERDAEAEAQYKLALKLDPNHTAALNAIAAMRIAEYQKGLQLDDTKRDAALAAWKQSLEINPQQQDVKEKVETFKD